MTSIPTESSLDWLRQVRDQHYQFLRGKSKEEIKAFFNRALHLPTHPGQVLLEVFLLPMGLTAQALAEGINVPFETLDELIQGKQKITPSLALRLAKFFDISADVWLTLQIRSDLDLAKQEQEKELDRIQPYFVYNSPLNGRIA